MSLLLSAHYLSKSYGAHRLFQGVSFGIEDGDRIGLIGPNGAGKTSLLEILAGRSTPDDGSLSYRKGLRLGFLEQVPTLPLDLTVIEAVRSAAVPNPEAPWEMEALAQEYLSRLELDPETVVSQLSGGWRKKVALARELMKQPDLLLLDEPTNHLDVSSILWLESFLAKVRFATLIITHDRLFLQRVANRILELDRRNPNGLLNINGNYTVYLEAKEQLMNAQERQEAVLKNTLRRETEWLRRGPKARTTKQQARIDRAQDLKEQAQEITQRNQTRTVSIDFENTSLPKRLLEATNLSKTYGDRRLFSGVNLLLSPGTRVGLLGDNGAGKSTLIRILLGEENPDTGSVHRSDQLVVNYFQQNRESLDPAVSLVRTVSPHGDHVEYRGHQVHVKSYLSRFLFSPSQMDLPVGRFSGGEQSRILIAQLMLKPANLLVLDEPTNDLDMATLNVLQDCLLEFEGAILLVTHDRYFMDQVATKILAFSPASPEIQTFSDLYQWEAWTQNRAVPKAASLKIETQAPIPAPKKKLSYKDQREFDAMEDTIHRLESSLAQKESQMASPEVASSAAKLLDLDTEIKSLKSEIDRLYQRWAELETLTS